MHQKGRPHRRPQQRLDRRLEEVAKAVGGGYCRLQMPTPSNASLGRGSSIPQGGWGFHEGWCMGGVSV